MFDTKSRPKVSLKQSYSTLRVIVSKSIYMCNLFLLLFILLFPREVLNASREGLILWFNNVLPALLPFIVITNMLAIFGFVRHISKWLSPFMYKVFKLPGAGCFALITGLISGYPMGAKTIADLWRTKEITTIEAQRLLAFCNNAGPLFIVGVVGVGFLRDTTAGYVLWAGHVLAALSVGILTRGQGICRFGQKQSKHALAQKQGFENYDARNKANEFGTFHRHEKNRTYIRNFYQEQQPHQEKPHIGKALGDSVKNAMEALLLVGGLIIFFSVIVRVVMIFFGNIPYIGILAGIIEITSGTNILSDALMPVSAGRMAVIGGIIAFGGFSVHAQALHFTADIGTKAGNYLYYKVVNGIIAAIFTGIIWGFISS